MSFTITNIKYWTHTEQICDVTTLTLVFLLFYDTPQISKRSVRFHVCIVLCLQKKLKNRFRTALSLVRH